MNHLQQRRGFEEYLYAGLAWPTACCKYTEKGNTAEGDVPAAHLLVSFPNRAETVAQQPVRSTVWSKHADTIILHELPVFKPVFLFACFPKQCVNSTGCEVGLWPASLTLCLKGMTVIMKEIRLAVVGATGMVGRTFLQVLTEFNLPVSKYVLFASARSAGSQVDFLGKTYTIQELTETSFDEGFDVALFSAGGSISAKFAPIAAQKGCVVVDNSSQWRMDESVPLVVPEVNPEALKNHGNIIANPNCSTIQAMLPIKAIMDEWGVERIIYSTYQSVSGAGLAGYNDLADGVRAFAEGKEYEPEKFPHPIFNNCIPHIDVFTDSGYTKEELKMVNESRKILGDPGLRVTATTVRVPVFFAHSESINIETKKPFEIIQVKEKLANFHKNLILVDDVKNNKYPLATDAAGKNEVFVGRVRRDESVENGINLWCVADNIRKGAATNTIQIAQYMLENDML